MDTLTTREGLTEIDEEKQVPLKENKALRYTSYVCAILYCPACQAKHVDKDIWAKRLHTTHLCEFCGELFKPFDRDSFGVER